MNLTDYELMMVIDPNSGEDKVEGLCSKIESRIKTLGGEVAKTDKVGIKRLASPFQKPKKLSQGYYVVIYFKAETSVPAKIQTLLKVTEEVVRYSILLAVPPEAPARIPGKPVEAEAVEVGEIKEAGESIGES